MPQGLLSGMYGGGAAGMPGGAQMPGMPMANAAPQLPMGMGGGGGGQPFTPHMTGPTAPTGAAGASPMTMQSLMSDPKQMAALKSLIAMGKGGGSDANPGIFGMLGSMFGGNPGNAGYSGLLGGSMATQSDLGSMSFADMLSKGLIAE